MSPELLAVASSLVTLAALEIILGVDNIIFLSILVGKLPREQQPLGRRIGLVLALGTRILLLFALKHFLDAGRALFTVAGLPVSGHTLVLTLGGAFLVAKSTWEIFSGTEAEERQHGDDAARRRAFFLIVAQIAVMDLVFSLDSVITAVGLAKELWIMVTAMGIAMLAMLFFARFIGEFVERHPSTKILALAFLILIGTTLVAEGLGQHFPKGYVYGAMAFSVAVEFLNIWLRKRADDVKPLHGTRISVPPPAPSTSPMPSPRERELCATIEEQRRKIAELEATLAGGSGP